MGKKGKEANILAKKKKKAINKTEYQETQEERGKPKRMVSWVKKRRLQNERGIKYHREVEQDGIDSRLLVFKEEIDGNFIRMIRE